MQPFKISLLAKSFLIALSMSLCLPTISHAEESMRSALDRAEQEFKAGNHAAAAEIMGKNAVEGSAAYLYNLGTAEFKAGRMGEALAHLTKAKALNPFDSDIRNNLEFVSSKLDPLARQIAPAHWAAFLPDYILENPAVILCAALAFFIMAVFAALLRKLAFVMGLATAGLFLAIYFSQPERAVITQKNLTLRSGPAATFAEITQLTEGAIVAVEERKDGWSKLAFRKIGEKSKEAIGWVEDSTITSLSK